MIRQRKMSQLFFVSSPNYGLCMPARTLRELATHRWFRWITCAELTVMKMMKELDDLWTSRIPESLWAVSARSPLAPPRLFRVVGQPIFCRERTSRRNHKDGRGESLKTWNSVSKTLRTDRVARMYTRAMCPSLSMPKKWASWEHGSGSLFVERR